MPDQVSIKQLPQVTEINTGDLLLVQTPNATNTLLFENFIIGLDNTTFSSTISSQRTDIDSLSSTIFSDSIKPVGLTKNDALNLSGIPIEIGGKTFNILLSGVHV